MPNQNQARAKQSSKNDQSKDEQQEGVSGKSAIAPKSIGAVIGESLAKDTQERVDQVLNQVNDHFRTAKEYVTENPKEAAAIVASVGLAAWVLLYTKPGRQVFEKGSAVLVPQISKWITANFGSSTGSIERSH